MVDLAALRALIDRLCGPGRTETAVPRLVLTRSAQVTVPVRMVYQPLVCLVAQGGKRVLLGDRVLEYRAGSSVVVSLDLPVSSEIHEASRQAPYLALSLALDPALLADLVLAMPARTAQDGPAAGLDVGTVTADVLDPVLRLLRLLDRPDDIPVLAPLVEREVVYRLLQGPQGPMLRQIALAESPLARVGRAIAWIHAHYREPMRIEALAGLAGMSASTFHRHFKAATAMSPLQFQKQIRLQEARRLLVSRQADASRVAFTVGYESPSQFSREYSRLFGQPPARDAAQMRALATATDAPPRVDLRTAV